MKIYISPGEDLNAALSEARGKRNPEILLRPGVHRLMSTLELGPEHTGLTIASESERATLSGFARLECDWRPRGNGVYVTRVSEGVRFGAQLFVNGVRQTLARWPKRGYAPVISALPANAQTAREDDDMLFSGAPPKGLVYGRETFTSKHWAHPERAVCHVFQAMYWGNLQFRLIARDERMGALHFGEGGTQIGAKWHDDPCKVNENSKFFVENIMEELSEPGEWCFDPDKRELHYIPPDDIDIHRAVFEAPQLETLVQMQGKRGDPVSGVVIRDLRLTGTTETFFEEYDIPSLSDWSIHRGGAVLLNGTRGCTVEACELTALGGNAIFVNGYNRGARVAGNRIHDVGESAICFVGELNKVVGSQRLFPYECEASHNIIDRCGVFGKQVAGVYISCAKRITAGHNHIHDMPRAGICIGDGTWGGHVIEYNRIHDTCLETGDHGPFNAWGRDRYWCLLHSHGPVGEQSVCHQAGDVFVDQMETVTVRNNLFREKSGWGLDLDDGASNYHIYDNICVGVSMKLREGAHRLIENNVWFGGANSPCFHVGNAENHDRYLRNITVMDTNNAKPEHDLDFDMGKHNGEMYTLIKPPAKGPWMEQLDYNLFWNDRGEFSARAITGEGGTGQRLKFDLSSWREMGFDLHSAFADPRFVDASSEDFRLGEDSPAHALGIRSIDTSGVGPDLKYVQIWEDSL